MIFITEKCCPAPFSTPLRRCLGKTYMQAYRECYEGRFYIYLYICLRVCVCVCLCSAVAIFCVEQIYITSAQVIHTHTYTFTYIPVYIYIRYTDRHTHIEREREKDTHVCFNFGRSNACPLDTMCVKTPAASLMIDSPF